MLQIRSEQNDALKTMALKRFEDEMVVHLGEFSPPLVKTLKEVQLRHAIRFGIKRAKHYNFTNRGPVRFYLEMMFMFGSHFDTDPQYPWASEILINQDADSQKQCADRLFEKTMDYRKQVIGPKDAYSLKALKKILILARHPPTLSKDDFIPAIRRQVINTYPEKAAYIGNNDLDTLIRESCDCALNLHFSDTRETSLLLVLMLTLGHGCIKDPLYPWISRTLADVKSRPPKNKARRLEKKSIIWLDHVLVYFEKEEQV